MSDIATMANIIEMLEKRLGKAQKRYEAASSERVGDMRFGEVVALQQAILEAKDILNEELIERDLRIQLEAIGQ